MAGKNSAADINTIINTLPLLFTFETMIPNVAYSKTMRKTAVVINRLMMLHSRNLASGKRGH